jgi:hypothetical protein
LLISFSHFFPALIRNGARALHLLSTFSSTEPHKSLVILRLDHSHWKYLFAPWPTGFGATYYSVPRCLSMFCCFFCFWALVLLHCGKIVWKRLFQYSYIFEDLLWDLWSILEKAPWPAEKNRVCAAAGWNTL